MPVAAKFNSSSSKIVWGFASVSVRFVILLKPSRACPQPSPSAEVVSRLFNRVPAASVCSWVVVAHQSTGGAVEGISVVPSELGVGSLERRVPVGLRLLDTVFDKSTHQYHCPTRNLGRLILPAGRLGVVAGRGPSAASSNVPVTVSLLALVVLRRVLRLYLQKEKSSVIQSFAIALNHREHICTYWPL